MNYHFFYSSKCPESQWFMIDMVIDGVTYNCCEQYMMSQKALLFSDLDANYIIMNTKSPKLQKAAGRAVKNYDDKVWKQHNEKVILKGNYYKFNIPEMKEYILSFDDDTVFVEASPYDKIYGIGLGMDDPLKNDPKNWKGTNLLGNAITEVFYMIKEIENDE